MRRKILVMLLAVSLTLGSAFPGKTAQAATVSNYKILELAEEEGSDITLPEAPAEPEIPETSESDPDVPSESDPETPSESDPDAPPVYPHEHEYAEWNIDARATAKKDGLETRTCEICRESEERIIPHPEEILLSQTDYDYNKKERKPKVTLLDSEGASIPKSAYTVAYDNNVMPGKARVTITLDTERYDAVLKSSFRINLPSIKLGKMKARTEGFLASWEPQTRYITGYQLQYSTSKDYTSKNTFKTRVKGRKQDSRIVRKLKPEKLYYVRLRTYMTTEDKTYYSAWSTSKKVTTKRTQKVTMVAVGDDLLHSPVYKSCKTKSGYNFNPVFAHVKDTVKAADLAVINQETILVPKNYTSYPCFGSPFQVADAIAKTGFDIVTCATNHTMDRGTASIVDTMNYWKKNYPEVTILGIHPSKADADEIKVVEKNGIKIAMLNYTYGTNGIRIPSDKSYMIDLLSNKDRIRSQIRKAKKISDLVIVYPHWGEEYQYSPVASQRNWAQFFADEGVDLVIGAHPHVLEPIKKVTGKSGNTMICYYSLGNFVSAQGKVPRALGGMADITIVKDSDGVRVDSYEMIPLVTHMTNGSKPYTVYKLEDYTDELARTNHLRNRTSETFNVKKLKDLYKYIMSR